MKMISEMTGTELTKYAQELKQTLKLRYAPDVFRSLSSAIAFAARSSKAQWVLNGDNDGESGVYLIACPSDATRLMRSGYEMAN